MLSTWIEAPGRGRQGGQVRAGMWSTVVVGTHPIETDQEVWLEIQGDQFHLGTLPAFWIENRGVNSLWHVPIPPLAVNARLKYRAGASQTGMEPVYSAYQEVVIRPNLPARNEMPMGSMSGPEGLVGNRHMNARVDERGATYDIYFPTVGLHSDVRPASGDNPQSRSHFRGILGGLATGNRLDWFSERLSWEAVQRYQGSSNLLVTELTSRHGRIRVNITDFMGMGPTLPTTAGGGRSPGQYFKRFRITNDGDQALKTTFGLYVHAEVNGGIGEPLLSWLDGERALLAINRGHGHANRKLSRDSTVEFALSLDERGPVLCEAVGANEAMLLRPLEIQAGQTVSVDLLVSGAFTGWKGDTGTFDHWLRPALGWFRSVDLDAVEQEAARAWEEYVQPLPTLRYKQSKYLGAFRRSALAAGLHADEDWGALASSFDRGIMAYCWPRDAMFAGLALSRAGHPEIARKVIEWLSRVRSKYRTYTYWFQKYTIDGWPEWETPSVDQTAMIPWVLEQYYRQTGELGFVAECWPVVEQAAQVCMGQSGHPGLRLLEDVDLISSAGLWDNRYAAFLYSNLTVVAGLRAAIRLAEPLSRVEETGPWRELADRIWERGILAKAGPEPTSAGLFDAESGRFLEARKQSLLRCHWAQQEQFLLDRSRALDVSQLAMVVPFGLLPADDPRIRATAEALLRYNADPKDPNSLCRWTQDPSTLDPRTVPSHLSQHESSSMATLWMARYLIELGRVTGEGAAWTRALALIDGILQHLGPLGLSLRIAGRLSDETSPRTLTMDSVWGLHAMLIESLLDLAGLDYDVPAKRLTLRPALPPAWQQAGLERPLRCGNFAYKLERVAQGKSYRLVVESVLNHEVEAAIEVACPGLTNPGKLEGFAGVHPRFDAKGRRLSWTVKLPMGESKRDWTWG